MQKLSRSIIALGGLAVLAACGDDVSVTPPTPPPAPTVTAVSVSPNSTTIAVGQRVILSANVEVNGAGVNTAVTWSSANTAIATVAATGEVTGVAAGQTTVRATSVANAGVSGSAAVTVTADRGVQSVTVAPTSAILAPGQTLQAAATVNLSAGSSAARTVTWTSSSAAVATVSATGNITAVAPGSATITATSTADPTVSAPLALTVRAPAPATISIQSITAGGLGAPVNIANVAGQIEVSLNVDPGDQVITKVDILIDNAVVYTQSFTSAQSQEMSLAAVAEALATIVGSINTADYNATTGVVKYNNGARLLSARASVSNGTNVATPSLTLQFNNINRFIETLTFGTTNRATAASAGGLVFEKGDLNVSVLPVIFNGVTMTQGTVTFGGCDASGTGARTRTLTAPAAGSGLWTASFGRTTAGGTIATAATVLNYEYSCAGNGENARLTAADNQGNNILFFDGVNAPATALVNPFGTPAAPAPAIRLDNRAPGAPLFRPNPNGRQNGWINATVGLTGTNNTFSLTSNNWLADGTADAGVGGYVRMMRIGDGPLVDAALAATSTATPTLPSPTVANVSKCAIISAADLLANESSIAAITAGTTCALAGTGPYAGVNLASLHLAFGVDIDAPTIAYNDAPAVPTSLAANARQNGATPGIGGEFIVTVADIGAIGVSGMLAGSPVRGSVIRRTSAGTVLPGDCVQGTIPAATGLCTIVNTGMVVTLPTVSTSLSFPVNAGQTVNGYYTFNGSAFDAAGNSTAIAATRTVVWDNVIPGLTTALFNVPLTGSTVAFTANANDNLDLWKSRYTMTYAGGLAGPIRYPDNIINTFNNATLANSNVPAGVTVTDFMRQVEDATNALGTNPLAVGGAFKPLTLTGDVVDQGNNSSGLIATNIPGASVTTGVSYVKAPANAQEMGSFGISAPSAATNVSDNAGPAAPVNPLSVVLQADAFGRTATLQQPFTRLTFYALFGGELIRVGDGVLQAIFDDGTPFGRRYRWTYTWTPGTSVGLGAISIRSEERR